MVAKYEPNHCFKGCLNPRVQVSSIQIGSPKKPRMLFLARIPRITFDGLAGLGRWNNRGVRGTFLGIRVCLENRQGNPGKRIWCSKRTTLEKNRTGINPEFSKNKGTCEKRIGERTKFAQGSLKDNTNLGPAVESLE